MTGPCVFLDRDGTLIADKHYLSQPEQVELYPGTIPGLKRMRELGFKLVLVTNQSGVGRGKFPQERVGEVHEHLRGLLAADGVTLDGVYYCPHTPDDACGCRKPQPGMIEQAVAALGVDPTQSFVIGDKPCDLELGRAVGAMTFLVRTGYGSEHEGTDGLPADFVVDDLADAAAVIERQLALRAMHIHSTAGLRMFAKSGPSPRTKFSNGIGVAILDDQGRVLLELRQDCELWGLPGGKLDVGESYREAATREVLEETGYTVELQEILGVYSDISEGRIITYLDNFDEVHLVEPVVTARIVSGELKKSPESLELRWFAFDELPQEICPPCVAVLDDLKHGRRGTIR